MRILLTNDDGFGSEGIEVLRKVLSRSHEVYVLAPSENRSGASASLAMKTSLSLFRHGENLYSLEGSPVDCTICALRGNLFPCKPDLVVSGINHGANLGTDITYSGTCGASRQSCLYGVPSIALSVASSEKGFDFFPLATFALNNLERLSSLCGKARDFCDVSVLPYFVNVNAPSAPYRGVRFTEPCHREYGDTVRIVHDGEGMKSSLLGGAGEIKNHPFCENPLECDGIALENGYVSVSLVKVMPACENNLCVGMEKDFVLGEEINA